MELKRQVPSVKLMTSDGRLIAKVKQPPTPNLPDIIVFGDRVFVNRDFQGYREALPHVCTTDDLVFVKDEPERGPCLATGCTVFAEKGASYCARHGVDAEHRDAGEEPRKGRRARHHHQVEI